MSTQLHCYILDIIPNDNLCSFKKNEWAEIPYINTRQACIL